MNMFKLTNYLILFFTLFFTLSTTNGKLSWNRFKDPRALCNDYTRSGYFISNVNHSLAQNKTKWVIFLESGGVCSTPDDCNYRYTNFRAEPTKNGNMTVSSLMSSLETFFSDELLSQGMEGYDILSTDPVLNPSFHDYIHVLLPYCTSDLWFGIGQDQNPIDPTPFSFSNTHTESFQFTFRGSVILNSLFTELNQTYKLNNASKVIFSGSSAGGIALFTHAKTLQTFLSPSTQFSVLGDSSWFINFQDSFEFINGSVLYYNLPAYPACRLLRHGVPCCISAPCMLTNNEFYPQNLKTLVFFSLYDIYLLNQTLGDQVSAENFLIFNILRIITELGGAMNHSLQLVESFNHDFSFIASSCLQHVFLATSSLWVEGPFGLFAETIQEEYINSVFSITVKPGIWTSYAIKLDGNSNESKTITIRDAITEWDSGAKIGYRDSCKSPHCNDRCPETLTLGLGTPFWPKSVQYTLIGVVLTIVIVCITIKLGMTLWYALIRRNQKRYVERHQKLRSKSVNSRGNTKSFQIMKCDPDDTVTLACLDIEYKVNISALAAKRLRYAEEDIEPLVLKSLDTINEDMLKTLDRKQMRRRHSGKMTQSMSTNDLQPFSPIHVQKESSFSSMGDFPDENPSTILLHNSPRRSTTMTFDDSPYKKKRLVKDDSMLFETLQRVASFPPESKSKKSFKNPLAQNSRTILKGISALFNPGELVAIMGPSGSGKTTLLDLLTGRRQVGEIKGSVFVNGFNVQSIRSWFVANTGYVLQQAQPFYEELTVRENLTFSAFMRLPSSMTLHHKLERVEEVLRETFLIDLGDTKVGRSGGPGLSGGQKRRLSVAVQLLKRPSLLFLDEPTSGLDASSSYELLTYLNHVAASDRTVIVTIHQPRFEIFHLFSKIILLCRGQIAYHGAPEKAYEVFVNAHKSFAYTRGIKLPDIEKHNPADVIMDILGSKESRSAILTYYRLTEESEAIYDAICEAQQKRKKYFGPVRYSQRFKGQKSSSFLARIATWEARASLRVTWSQLIYLPIVFTVYGLLLGSAYKQASEALLIISGFCVYSVASALFMFPIMFTYYQPTLKIYAQERADGAGHAFDLLFHGFVRFVSWAFLPVVSCCAVLYLFIVQYSSYDIWVFFQVMIINLALNHTWIALLMFIIFCFPTIAHRISPIVASVAGFAGGFFVPIHLMPIYYKFLFYINPNFYGFSASARIILDNLKLTCPYESELECYTTSANYTLQQFDFIDIQPYQHILILMCMTVIFLFLAHTALWIRYFNWRQFLKCSKSAKHLDIEDGVDMDTYLEGSTEHNPYTIPNNEKRQSSVGQNISNDFHWESPIETGGQEWTTSTKRSAPLSNNRSSIISGEQSSYSNFIFENLSKESPSKNNFSSPNLAISPDSDTKSRNIMIAKHRSFKVPRADGIQVESELVQSISMTNLSSNKKPRSLLKNPNEQIRDRQQNMYHRIQEYNLVSKDIEDDAVRDRDLTFRKKSSNYYQNTTKKIDKKLFEELNFCEFESHKKLEPLSRKVSKFEVVHIDGSSTLPTKFASKDDFEDTFIDSKQEPVRSFDVLGANESKGPELVRRNSF